MARILASKVILKTDDNEYYIESSGVAVPGGYTLEFLDWNNSLIYVFSGLENSLLLGLTTPTREDTYTQTENWQEVVEYFYLSDGEYVSLGAFYTEEEFEEALGNYGELFYKTTYLFNSWKDDENNIISFPYALESDHTIRATYDSSISMVGDYIKITNLGSSNPNDVVFQKSQNFPATSELYEIVRPSGEVYDYLKFPTWYKKNIVDENNNIIGMELSNVRLNASFLPYQCFVDENGNILPYILIASFNSFFDTGLNFDNFRTQIRNKGTGWQLFDIWTFVFLRDLWLGCSETIKCSPATLYGKIFDYLILQDVILDGINYEVSTEKTLYCKSPSKYVTKPTISSEGYQELNYQIQASSSYVQVLGYDSNAPSLSLPKAGFENATSSTYYCSLIYLNESTYNGFTAIYPNIFLSGVNNANFFGLRNVSSNEGTFPEAIHVKQVYRPIE